MGSSGLSEDGDGGGGAQRDEEATIGRDEELAGRGVERRDGDLGARGEVDGAHGALVFVGDVGELAPRRRDEDDGATDARRGEGRDAGRRGAASARRRGRRRLGRGGDGGPLGEGGFRRRTRNRR